MLRANRLLPILCCSFAIALIQLGARAQEKHAVLVGISTYKHARLNEVELQYPEADAKAIKELLERSGFKVDLLTGKQATRENVRSALRNAADQANAEGVLILGFFGHGVQYGTSAYFCPYDAGVRNVSDSDGKVLRGDNQREYLEPDPATLVAMRDMLDVMNRSPAGNKLLLADCCREDPSRARSLRARAFGSAVRVDELPRNCAALFACSEGERAFEHEDWEHGAFTRAILDVCSSKTRVTAAGLSDAVYFNVENLVQKFGEKQHVNILLSGGVIDLKLTGSVPETTPVPSGLIRLVQIDAGRFMMGGGAIPRESPKHEVQISRAFRIGATEVTRKQWLEVMGTIPWGSETVTAADEDIPATNMTWQEASEFCRKLSTMESKKYRLPTEAEWEYVCRANSSSDFCFGGDSASLGEYAWFKENASDAVAPMAVGKKKPNDFGVFDMHGNVHEFCQDWYEEQYYGHSPSADPTGPATGTRIVARGGTFQSNASYLRSAARIHLQPDFGFSYVGFRVVCEND